MEPYVAPLPASVTTADLDRAFAVERVVSEDSNPFKITSRETLLKASAGGPYSVSLYRYDTARYHRRPCVTLTPTEDGRSVAVTWVDTTERQFWIITMAAGAVFAIAAIVFGLSITPWGLFFVLPAVMLVVIAQRSYRSSTAVRRNDSEDAVKVALQVAGLATPEA